MADKKKALFRTLYPEQGCFLVEAAGLIRAFHIEIILALQVFKNQMYVAETGLGGGEIADFSFDGVRYRPCAVR